MSALGATLRKSSVSVMIAMGVFIAPAKAQVLVESIVTIPEPGVIATIAPGDEVYRYIKAYTADGATLDERAKAGAWLMGKWYEVGTKLVAVPTQAAFKACISTPGTLDAVGPCFLDDNGDGRFDRQEGGSILEGAKKMKSPARYSRSKIQVFGQDSKKSVILFQGGTADSLRFSYREFAYGQARPAFTEELVVPRESFPQMVRLKDRQFEILDLSGMGLSYRLVH